MRTSDHGREGFATHERSSWLMKIKNQKNKTGGGWERRMFVRGMPSIPTTMTLNRVGLADRASTL